MLLVCGVGTDIRAYHRPLPSLALSLSGGLLKVSATVANTGDGDLNNLTVSFSVVGGVLKRINLSATDAIPSLPAHSETTVSTPGALLGFGKISVDVDVEGILQSAEGFILGPFIALSQSAGSGELSEWLSRGIVC